MRQRAWDAPTPTGVPPIVGEVLRSSGQPLDADARGFFEDRFGHDFSQVRVHTDAWAAESARAVNARAYTVGRDVVFSAGTYAPSSPAGRRLLAHELSHVVQQGNATSGAPLPSSISNLTDPLEEEAEQTAARVMSNQEVRLEEGQPAAVQRLHRAPFALAPLVDIQAPIQAISRLVQLSTASCDHGTLTWADFTAAAPARSPFSAQTGFHFERATSGSDDIVKAFFDPGSSWVRRQFANPTDRAQNGGTGQVGACQRHFDRETAAAHVGITYHLAPGRGCAASVGPDPSVTAKSRQDCVDVLGPEWDRAAVLESARLLKHEQTHYDLACALARKGTMAIVGSNNTDNMLRDVRSASGTQTASYDNETAHGCNAGPQAAWEKSIRDGLQAVTIPLPAAPARRRP